MASSGFELVANHAQSQQPHTEGVFLVGGHGFGRAGIFLPMGLSRDCHTKLDVCLDFPSMEIAVKGSELDGALLKHRV